MNTPTLGGKLTGQENATLIVRNDEASATISKGQPVCFNMDGSREGKDVVLPGSLAAATANGFFAGIALENIASQQSGKVQCRGVIQSVRVVLMTRAATTDGWASYPAYAVGDVLILNTVGNAMSRSTAGAATIVAPQCVAMQTLASATTQASTTSNTSLVSTTTIKAFLRVF